MAKLLLVILALLVGSFASGQSVTRPLSNEKEYTDRVNQHLREQHAAQVQAQEKQGVIDIAIWGAITLICLSPMILSIRRRESRQRIVSRFLLWLPILSTMLPALILLGAGNRHGHPHLHSFLQLLPDRVAANIFFGVVTVVPIIGLALQIWLFITRKLSRWEVGAVMGIYALIMAAFYVFAIAISSLA